MVKQSSFSPIPSTVCVYLDTPFYRIPTIILGRPFSEILELHSRLSLHLACPSEVYIHSFHKSNVFIRLLLYVRLCVKSRKETDKDMNLAF